MEALTLGFALGVGAVLVAKGGRERIKRVVGWTARNAGWVSAQAKSAIAESRRALRERYQRDREEARDDAPP
jgi:hypothetical protein